MSLVFIGIRQSAQDSCNVYMERDGKRYQLTRSAGGGRRGLCWDQAGPSSAELAQVLLWKVTGLKPKWSIYQIFKSEVVATFPLCDSGECWRLSEEEIRDWLARLEDSLVRAESPEQTESRHKTLQHWNRRVRRLASYFRRKERHS